MTASMRTSNSAGSFLTMISLRLLSACTCHKEQAQRLARPASTRNACRNDAPCSVQCHHSSHAECMCRSRPGHRATFSLPLAASLASLINCTACSLADDMFRRLRWSGRAKPPQRGLYIHITSRETNQHVMPAMVMQAAFGMSVERCAGAEPGPDQSSRSGSRMVFQKRLLKSCNWRHTDRPFISAFSHVLAISVKGCNKTATIVPTIHAADCWEERRQEWC